MISRVWPNSVASMPLSTQGTPMLASADAASLDANIQQALDKSISGDNVYGSIIIGPGATLSLDSPTSIVSSGSGGITVASGGSIQCANNDFPTFASAVQVSHYIPFTEMFANLSGITPPGLFPIANVVWDWYQDTGLTSGTSGVVGGTSAFDATPNSGAIIPITRMHDGATCTEFIVYFSVSSGRANLPARYPGFAVVQYDPFLNVWTFPTGGWSYFPAPVPANVTAYMNGGIPNFILETCDFVVDAAKYLYFMLILDEDYGSDAGASGRQNEWLGFAPVSNALDMRFQ